MITRLASAQRVQTLTPSLASGISWLFDVVQPPTALVRPEGVALPVVAGRRLIFAPGGAGQGAAVIIQAAAGHPGGDLEDEEISQLALAVEGIAGVAVRVETPTGAVRAARIQLSRSAHPSLLAALARFRSGCPVHHRPACGHTRGAEAPCQWFARGARALIAPAEPVVLPAVPVRHAVSEASVAGLIIANARRRDSGARRAVGVAREAIAMLSRRPHRGAATEEVLRVLRLRVEHPELSLRELAALHEPPMTKDSYAARLRRALQLVEGSAPAPAGERSQNTAA